MRLGFLILVPLPWMFNFFLIVYANSEGDALSALKSSLSDPDGVLTSWDPTLVNPCTWFHITCDINNSVTRIDLGKMNLSGPLVPQLGSLPNLQYLELYNNNISGEIPRGLGNLTSLVSLDLYSNALTGPIPDDLGKLSKLRFLRLHNNTLSGPIPMSLTNVASLWVLDLSYNNLSGYVPENGSFYTVTLICFPGNSHLKLKVFPTMTPETVEVEKGATGGVSNAVTIAIAAVVAGAVAALLFVAFASARVWWRRRKVEDHFFNVSAEDDPEIHLGALQWFYPRALNKFSLSELQVVTDNFDPKNIVGRGGFGEVYKGCLADGSVVAVKRLKEIHNKVEELQFQAEVEMISLVVHRNLLRLQGFCMTATEKLLVYPYMANGSVASCLRARQGSQPLLDWPKRKHIALGSARGLVYLHHQFEPIVIHRDVKAANILLDDEFEAVVGDFGLAKLMNCMDTHATPVCGTLGHIAPEYLSHGKCSEKTDVFGYGVMLLELISGQNATDIGKLAIEDGFMPHNWVKGLLKDKKLERLVDGDLQGNYVEEEVERIIQVALLCTQSSPMQRPTMYEVVQMLEGKGLAKRWEEWQRQEAFFQGLNHTLCQNGGWIVDSTSKLHPDELSAPR